MSPATRPTLLLDIGPLGSAWNNPSGARGIHRVAQHLFRGLQEADRYDLRFISTADLAGAYDFLAEEGLQPRQTLRCTTAQLRFSRLGRRAANWVHRNIKIPGLPARAARRAVSLVASAAFSCEKKIPPEVFAGIDLFHSSLAPLPQSMPKTGAPASFLTIHDLLALRLPRFMPSQGIASARRLIDSLTPDSRVFCVSESVKADVLEFASLPAERVFVTPLAADQAKFYPETDSARIAEVKRRHQLPDAPYFLTLSSFDPRKNFGHIIECFRDLVLSADLRDTKLVIVGSNPERNRFVDEALAKNAEVRNQIVIPGFIPDDDLAAVYSGALAFLFPSFGEGFGLPALEAMQCGTPVICSNITSIPEVVGTAGVLLDPQDKDAWCQAMLALASDASARETLHRRGIERAKEFTWERFMRSTFQGYAEGLANR
jgi:glycosyltransferase involved in cell wall biosynthesis